MYGTVTITMNNKDIYTGIIHHIVDTEIKGKYFAGNQYEPPEFPELEFEKMYIECYDLKEEDAFDIKSIEITELLVDKITDKEVDYGIDLLIENYWYDFQSSCLVIECV